MRRNKSTALKPKTVITSVIICACICFAGIGYVWAKTQVWGLSRDIKKLELRLEELKRDNDVLQRNYAEMCAPAQLDYRVRKLNLGLAAPLPSQIVRMPSRPHSVARKSEVRDYASTNHD
jgi:hypothetical protein